MKVSPPDDQVIQLNNIGGFTSIAADGSQLLATKWDGTLWVSGGNSSGELGVGDTLPRNQLTMVPNLDSVMAAEAGSSFSMAILSNRTVVAWGLNDHGQLGIGNNVPQTNVPTPVLTLTNVVALSCGWEHSLALTGDGKVWAWGANESGQLGLNDTLQRNAPAQISSLSNVISIAAGEGFSMAAKSDGTVYVWGEGGSGKLGLGSDSSNKKVPTLNSSLSKIRQVRAGSKQGYALDTSSNVWTWGVNHIDTYTLGNVLGFPGPDIVSTPTNLFLACQLSNVVYLAVGSPKFQISGLVYNQTTEPGGPQAAAALCADGSVWRWGIPWMGLGPVTLFDPKLTNDCTEAPPYPGSYIRGSATNADFASFVLPLDFQVGEQFANSGGTIAGYFPFLTNNPLAYHYNYNLLTTNDLTETNLSLRTAYQNPIAAFGARPGGSVMYTGRSYRFVTYGGAPDRFLDYPYLNNGLDSLEIEVYSKSNYSLIGIQSIPVPDPYDMNQWTAFLTNGLESTVDAYGLKTTVSTRACPDFAYGVTNGGVLELSQMADDIATNYIYVIRIKGLNSYGWVSLAADLTPSWQPLYTVEFDPAPPSNVRFLTDVQYDTVPLPPFYNGKTPGELITNSWPVTNAVYLTNAPASYTNLDESPELARHPILDDFVDSLKHDPLAIARFVQNEIELTDGMDCLGTTNQMDIASLKLGGVNRSALGVFLERQGSPVEQCSLLIYLLRQAGVPAVYIFPTNNGVQMYDQRLSNLLRFQLHDAIDQASLQVSTNSMIAINYPWVAAYINNQWIHLFPWLKDTEVVQGPNVYDFLPDAYNTPMKWCVAYLYNDPQIMGLGDPNDVPERLFPRFVNAVLATNAVGLSYDDFGVQCVNRQKAYNTWDEFPKPTWVASTNIAADSLSDSIVTGSTLTNFNPNIFPPGNIFNTVEIVVKTNNVTLFDTEGLRACDLHDRPFLLYSERSTSNPNSTIAEKLYLAPFRPTATNIDFFTNNVSLTNCQVNCQLYSNLLSADTKAITATIIVNRYRPAGENTDSTTNTLLMQKGDLNALCLDYGRVSTEMLEPLATTVQNVNYQIKQTPSITNTLTADQYQGPLVYLMGMTYFEKIGSFVPDNARLHGRSPISYLGIGAAKLVTRKDDNSGDGLPSGKMKYVQPCVDMHAIEENSIAAPTVRPDSPGNVNWANDGFNIFALVDGSAKEHDTINGFFGQGDAVSTVRLLQLAASRHAANPDTDDGIVVVNQNTAGVLSTRWNTWYREYGVWAAAPETYGDLDNNIETNVLQAIYDSPESQAFLTPGSITNNTSSYQGVGALVFDRAGVYKALITSAAGPLNGGYGEVFPDDFDWYVATGLSSSSLSQWGFYSIPDNSQSILALPQSTSDLSFKDVLNLDVNKLLALAPSDVQAILIQALGMNTDGSFASTFYTVKVSGYIGPTISGAQQSGASVYDPVNSVTGEFHIDTTDLSLVGPLPLEIRRNYSSFNPDDNEFGHGWNPSFVPFISMATNEPVLYVAEPSGGVLAYEPYGINGGGRTNWQPSLLRNPELVNNRDAGIGSTANLFLSRIIQTNMGAVTNYILYSPNGDVRDYQVMPFVLTNVIDLTRPYLTKWMDSRGNSLIFSYGTNAQASDYAQLTRVDSSSGAYLQFQYDASGHIVDALSGDGRETKYTYDQFGDLVNVVLADASQVNYVYEHGTESITNNRVIAQVPYSTHLLVQEIKPEGRILANSYDDQNRVIAQASTVGPDLSLVTNATFAYVATGNPFVLTNSATNTVSGYTTVVDVFGNATRFDYTNSRITKITDPLGQSIQQIWYDENTNQPGYYPRSLWKRIDKRGLTTEFRYDSFGNVTNVITSGANLTGAGGGEALTNLFVYDTNNLPIVMVDPLGNSNVVNYDPVFAFEPKETIIYKQGLPIVTNETDYGIASNVVVFGGEQWTNMAYGLATNRIFAYTSRDAATNESVYNGSGFLTSEIDFTSGSDPAISNYFSYNGRGQLFARVDSAGRTYRYDFDAFGRKTSEEEYDAGEPDPMSWQYYYYNGDGDLTWYDGPQFDPEDYVWYDYDGAGRKTAEVHWRSKATDDGSGVESDTNLYAITSYEYDAFGNLIKQTDPVGNYLVMSYDTIGQMLRLIRYTPDGTPLSTNQTSYEQGGQVAYATNSLGGVTHTLYTTAGKPYFRSNPDGSTNQWRYDLLGRVTQEFEPNGSHWDTIYDDVDRAVVRQFKDSGGSILATTTNIFDRRGNLITNITAEGAIFYSVYDQQNRLKVSGGPATLAGVSTQQVSYVDYDGAGVFVTNRDSLGLRKVTQYDATHRPVSIGVYDTLNGNSLISTQAIAYSSNHHAITVISGSGSGAISTTTFYDSFNSPVLMQSSPSVGETDFTITRYDLDERVVQQQDELGRKTTLTYDGLGRVSTKQLPDTATVTSSYNPEGGMVSMRMPGSLVWSAMYNSANQRISEQLFNGTSLTRQFTNVLYTSGPLAGLPQQTIDVGRQVTSSFSYDSFRRVATNSAVGLLPEQIMVTSFQYDRQGLVTNYTQTSGVNPTTSVIRYYDGYKQLTNEQVAILGVSTNTTLQGWTAAGRRSELTTGAADFRYNYRVDGLVSNLTAFGYNYGYIFGNNGLLLSRTNIWRTETVNQRDGRGRVTQESANIYGTPVFTENLSWRADSTLSYYQATRSGIGAWTNGNLYAYNLRGQLTNEPVGISNGTNATYNYAFDGNKIGVRVDANLSGAGWQSTSLTPSNQVFIEQWQQSSLNLRADGSAGTASSVSTKLDTNTWIPTTLIAGRWYRDLSLSTGTHTLTANAAYSAGQFTNSAISAFTVVNTNSVTNYYDFAGNITNRFFGNGRTQLLKWDAAGRLVAVVQRENANNGFNWSAIYDALGRRLRTIQTPIINGQTNSVMALTLDSYYDPEVEFGEIGIAVDGQRTWKVTGPDLNGAYGGLQGVGGLEATVTEVNGGPGTTVPVLNDYSGNVLATVSNGTPVWNPTRVGSYGAVLGYQAPVLNGSTPLAETLVWRSRRTDPTGFYWLGARYYDPMAGRFISADPLGHVGSWDLYSFANGDPVNRFDPDGRFGKSNTESSNTDFDSQLPFYMWPTYRFGANYVTRMEYPGNIGGMDGVVNNGYPDVSNGGEIGPYAVNSGPRTFWPASTTPGGAPNIEGTPVFIDADAANVGSQADIVESMRNAGIAESQIQLYLQRQVANAEGEVPVISAPPGTVRTSDMLMLDGFSQSLTIFAMANSANNLWTAYDQSAQTGNYDLLANQGIREAGGWGGSFIGGAVGGAIYGFVSGIETGPGAVVTTIIGAGVGGYYGYKSANAFVTAPDPNWSIYNPNWMSNPMQNGQGGSMSVGGYVNSLQSHPPMGGLPPGVQFLTPTPSTTVNSSR